MKKKYIFYTAVAVLAFVACSKEKTVEVPAGTTLKAVIGTEETKASHTHYKDVVWASGDALAVYTTDASYTKFDLTAGDGTTDGTFTAGSVVTPSTFAIYPYSAAKSFDGSKDATITLPAEYTWSEQGLNAPMLALVSGSDLAVFRQLGGYFKLDVENLPAEASKFVFYTEDQVITGDFFVDVTNAWPGIYTWNVSNEWDQAKRTVTVHFTAGEKTSRTFYIPVPVGNYTKFKVSIQDAGGTDLITPKTWTSSGTPVSMGRGTLKVLPSISCKDVSEWVAPLWKGSVATGNWANAVTNLSWGGGVVWDDANVGDIIRVHYSGDSEIMVVLKDASWVVMDGTCSDYHKEAGEYVFDYTLTETGLANLHNNNGLIVQGQNATITQIDLVKAMSPYRAETVVWTGYAVLDGWQYSLTDLEAGFWAGVSAGQIITIYHDEIAQDAYIFLQLHYTSPSWTTVKSWGFNTFGSLSHSYTLTAEDITHLKAGGAAIQSTGLAITKITLR